VIRRPEAEAAPAPSPVRLRPNLTELYRQKADPELRGEVMESSASSFNASNCIRLGPPPITALSQRLGRFESGRSASIID